MKRSLTNRRGGFTLVEIMIVVAIIALLATIAVPNFLRSRKRAQATALLEEVRLIDGAKQQYGVENNKGGTVQPRWVEDLKPYIKPGTRLSNSTAPVDPLGTAIDIGTMDEMPTIDAATITNFSDVITDSTNFWGSYAGTAS